MAQHSGEVRSCARARKSLRALLLVGVSAGAVTLCPAAAFAQATPQQGSPAQDNNTTNGSASAAVSAAPKSPETSPEAGTANGGEITPTTAAPVEGSTDNVNQIVVTGLRGSLQRNLDIKRAAAGVVDAISAEDIGKFPDSNVAGALQRVPGVSISRGTSSLGGLPATTGDASEITVRGFGPTFNETLFDGRQISTGTGSRAFDFSTVGADFVSEVDILKTPDAALSSGAIGATINIQYPKPFDHPGLRLAISGSGSYNGAEKKAEPAGNILFSDTFNDTFGILADFAYSKHRTQTNHINNQGWEGTYFAPCQLAGTTATTCSPTSDSTSAAYADANNRNTVVGFYSQDYGIYREDTTDTRYDGRLALQWHPSDNVLITANDDFSREKVRAEQYGFSVWFNSGNLRDMQLDENGTSTSYVQPATPTDFQGQINQEVLMNNEFGLNMKWDATDHLKIELDGDRALSWLNPNGQISSIDADVGYGGPNTTSLGFQTNGKKGLPTITNYGPAGDEANLVNPAIIGSHVLPISSARNKDRLTQFKGLVSWTEDQLKLTAGAQYVADRRQLSNYSDFVNNQWQSYSGYGPASGSQTGVDLPDSFFGNSFSTGHFIPGYSTGSGLPPRVLAFNPYDVLNYLQGLGNPYPTDTTSCNTKPNAIYPKNPKIPGFNYCGGINGPYDGTYTIVEDPTATQVISEKTLAGFVTASFKTTVADMPLAIQVGVRQEWTRTNSAGLAALPVALLQQPGDLTALAVQKSDPTAVSTGHKYSYLLPNFDLNLDVTDKLKLRFDASRTLTRPPLNYLSPVLSVPSTVRVAALTASGGNPTLNPFVSDNLDLGAEWYYQRNSYLSIDGFRKRVSNFVVGGSDVETINGVIDPTTGQPGRFVVTKQVNGPAADVYGFEAALQQVFGSTGFGFQANVTIVGTNKPFDKNDLTTSGFAVTGLANSANGVFFYDKNGFQARVAVNWRADYLDHFGQQQNTGSFGNEPTYVAASTQVDFSSSYDITKNISVFFEALNLNDAAYVTHGRYSNQILDAFRYGRRLTLGAHLRF